MKTTAIIRAFTRSRVSARLLSSFVATLALGAPQVAWTQPAEVAVLPASAVNLTDGEADAMALLLGEAYARQARVTVADLKQSKAAMLATKSLPEAAAQLGVSTFIQVRAARLGEKIMISTALVQRDGVVLHRAEMTAGSLDDVEVVSTRLARALVRRISTAQSLTLEDVTERETQTTNQKATRKVMGVKTGIHKPFVSGAEFGTGVSLQFDGRFEGKNYFLEIGAGALLSDSDYSQDPRNSRHGLNGVFAEIGASYYLTNSVVSPYVGGGISPKLLSVSDTSHDDAVKCTVYGQGGLMFFREARTRVYAELRISQNLLPYDLSRTYYDNTANATASKGLKSAYPTEVGFQVGIGW